MHALGPPSQMARTESRSSVAASWRTASRTRPTDPTPISQTTQPAGCSASCDLQSRGQAAGRENQDHLGPLPGSGNNLHPGFMLMGGAADVSQSKTHAFMLARQRGIELRKEIRNGRHRSHAGTLVGHFDGKFAVTKIG